MAIVNRTLDVSQQREVVQGSYSAVATGVTLNLGVVPYPATFDGGQIAAWGLSGTPSYEVSVQRFIVGSGVTKIVIATGTSNLPPEFGTSGVGISAMIIPAAGSTLLNLQANDLLYVVSGGSNAAVKALSVAVVLKPLQDIKQRFGIGL